MDNNLTPEQIAAEQDRLNAIRDGTAGQKDYNAQSKSMMDALKGLGKATVDYTKRMNDGASGAQEFNGTIDALADGVKIVTGLLVAMGGPLTWLVAAVGAATVGVLKYGKAAAKQADELFKTYQDLNKVGASGAGGMRDVFDNMQKFGYNLKELDKMTNLIAQNSQTLSRFGGTVAQGTKRFANLSDELTKGDIGRQFLAAGMGIDDINQSAATYLKQQTQLGAARKKTDAELAAGAAALTSEFDTLRRLTGDTIAEQKKKQDELVQSDVGNQILADLQARADKGDVIAGKQLEKLNAVIQQVPEGLRSKVIGSLGGKVDPAAQRILGPALNMIRDENASREDTINAMRANQNRMLEINRGAAKMGSTALTGGVPIYQLREQAELGDETLRRREAELSKVPTDKATENMVDLTQAQRESTKALQSFVNAGILPATAVLKTMAEVGSKAYNIPGKVAPDTFGSKAGSYTGASQGGSLDAAKAALAAKAAAKETPTGAPGTQSPGFKATSPATPVSGTSKEYYDKMYNKLLEEGKKQGIANPEAIAKLGAAQTSLETGYGKHMVGNNAFGIKAKAGGASVGASTQEFENGKMVTKNQNFRKYNSPEESAADFISFLKENKRYKGVLESKTGEEAIAAQGKTGYATDPAYFQKLADINGKMGANVSALTNLNTKTNATAPAGPAIGGFKPQLAGVKPEAATPPPSQNQQSESASMMTGIMDMLKEQKGGFDAMLRAQASTAQNTKKLVQRTS
jgi:flagellum-specific peptidoglycan hydrolase FlgJ